MHIVQTSVIPVGDDGLAAALELIEVVDDEGTEEGGVVGQGGFIDDDLCAFGFDTLHDTLDGGLAKVIRVRLHGQTIDADRTCVLLRGIKLAFVVIIVIAGFGEDAVGDEVLACAVRFNDGFDEVLRHVLIVRQQLFGVLRQAVTAISKRRVVIVRADTWIETNTID